MGQFAISTLPLLHQASSLLLYQTVLAEAAGQAFVELLQALDSIESREIVSCLKAYGRWFNILAERNQNWQDYLLLQMLRNPNPFTRQLQHQSLDALPSRLLAATRYDLQILQTIYHCDAEIHLQVEKITQCSVPPVVCHTRNTNPLLEEFRAILLAQEHWADALPSLAAFYQKHGVGLFAEYQAFRWQAGTLLGIAYPDLAQINDLVGYEVQKETLLKNTEFLLQGYPALHVLLYGSRGSGKSSLVKGLLHRYAEQGLRLVEVAKSDLAGLPVIMELLRDQPQKFVIFVDDLSFEEDDDNYKALKVVLEGNLTARPPNVVVYATSNRRHLIREFFGDRPRPKDGEEVHAWDTVQEKLSFSDRFGLTLTFEPADQTTYLQIVHHLATQTGISLSREELDYRALQWATRHNGRSGRTARQLIDYLRAEQGK